LSGIRTTKKAKLINKTYPVRGLGARVDVVVGGRVGTVVG
jgi:hypothetical protein